MSQSEWVMPTTTNPPSSVQPSTKPEGHVVLTLLASDPDMAGNGHLTFTFSSVTHSKIKTHFAINATTSELKLVKALDYEKDKLFRFP